MPHGLLSYFRRRSASAYQIMSRLNADDAGGVTIPFGLMMIAVVMIVGLSVDYGKALRGRDRMQDAVDAAALAAGRSWQMNQNAATAAQVAQDYYSASKPTDFQTSLTTTTLDTINQTVTLVAQGSIPTPFMSIAGKKFSQMAISAHTQASLQMGGNGQNSLEIAMMLDTTGSMGSDDGTGHSKISTLRTAAANLVNLVVWQDQSQHYSKIAVVPFSEGVNVGSTYAPLVRGTPASTYTFNGNNYKLSTCVTERTGSDAYTDAAPGSGNWAGVEYTSNGSCPETTQLIPLTNDKSQLIAAISGLQANNSTAGHIGTAWAWYALSPNWANVWPAVSAPSAYGTSGVQKIALLMTDGMYNTQYCNGVKDANSGGPINCNSPNGSSINQALSLCRGMKQRGITVYTIGFRYDPAEAATAEATLQQCATDPSHYFNATDGTALQQAFTAIALQITSLRLTQ